MRKAGLKFDIKLFVIGKLKEAEGNVARRFFFWVVLVAEEGPAAIGGATAIVLFHNHPSGDPTPSPDDVALTRRLVAAGALIGIEVVDHVILGDARYCSIKGAKQR